MATFLKLVCIIWLSVIIGESSALSMGGKPEIQNSRTDVYAAQMRNATLTQMTIADVGHVFWPDTNSTELQQEETLKNILGKRVDWKISVAQIQRNGDWYLIQGQSSKDMVGTFSYVVPVTTQEKDAILNASRGTTLNITGIVQDMEMRHIVLRPAHVIVQK